ncbi:MAG: type VI secretion system baseplate subunit TssG [Fibromonadales bacterium]|nr:type VI secretion system baseplate subunit TssG [Fibromonadales bacterium]
MRNSFFEWMLQKQNKKIRIVGSNSLKYPSGDIDFVKIKKNEIVLGLNEMSLCGADSPLPDSFLRGIRVGNENALVLMEFLNMFQHYLAMLRFSVFLAKRSDKNRIALYDEKFSPEYLRCFFAKIFKNCKVEVHCFEPLRIENPAPIVLGKGGKILGNNCTSLTAAMRVEISGIPLEQSRELKRNFIKEKFPFKIKMQFRTKIYKNDGFHLGTKNFEDFKWEKWL